MAYRAHAHPEARARPSHLETRPHDSVGHDSARDYARSQDMKFKSVPSSRNPASISLKDPQSSSMTRDKAQAMGSIYPGSFVGETGSKAVEPTAHNDAMARGGAVTTNYPSRQLLDKIERDQTKIRTAVDTDSHDKTPEGPKEPNAPHPQESSSRRDGEHSGERSSRKDDLSNVPSLPDEVNLVKDGTVETPAGETSEHLFKLATGQLGKNFIERNLWSEKPTI